MKIKELTNKKSQKEGYYPAAFSGDAATLGPDNVVSPVGSVPKNQINKKKTGKSNGRAR